MVSPTCKRETADDHQRLIELCLKAIERSRKDNPDAEIWSISTDGDSRRRGVFYALTTCQDLPPDDLLRKRLGEMPLFDYRCGKNHLTASCDPKHCFKRLRNKHLTDQGTAIMGHNFNDAVLRVHLSDLTEETLNELLNPNDKQDVTLMNRLLGAVVGLGVAHEIDSPIVKKSRTALRLLGCLYHHFLETYTNIRLNLTAQLQHLAAASHLMMCLYNLDKGRFMTVQLYYDLTVMVKDTYFCVAKTQLHDPDGQFWIILLGTDGLEKLFGIVRTIARSDMNCDALQLTDRLGISSTCNRILAHHPDWLSGPRRLSLKAASEQGAETSQKLDHINPASWKGNLYVKNVVLRRCWSKGREDALKELQDAGVNYNFDEMEARGCSMTCPLKMGQVVGIGAKSSVDEVEDEEDDIPETFIPASDTVINIRLPLEDHITDIPELDELAAAQLERKYEAWVKIDPDDENSKLQHKSTVMRVGSKPHTSGPQSQDRLRRVCGYTRHPTLISPGGDIRRIQITEGAGDRVNVLDPVCVLLRCSKSDIFLGIAQVTRIRIEHQNVDAILTKYMDEPDITFSFQIIDIVPIANGAPQDGGEWEWCGKVGVQVVDVSPKLISTTDAVLLPPTTPAFERFTGANTYRFSTQVLNDIGCTLVEKNREDFSRIPEVKRVSTFPYQSTTGEFQ